MTSTTSQARCVFCGTQRPVTVPVCPTCGRGWIDQPVVGAPSEPSAAGETGASVASPVQPYPKIEHDAPPTPPPSPPPQRRWPAILGVAAGVVAVYILIVVVFLGNDAAPIAEGTTTTTMLASSTTAASSTIAATTTVPGSTTSTTTATSTTTTTTTTTTTSLPPLEAIGDPLPLEELTLGAFALGPFEFEAPNPDVLGRLVATLGQPDSLVRGSTDFGLCPGDGGTAVTWGALTATFTTTADGETLVGYQLGNDRSHDPDLAGTLVTLSGLRVGDTIGTLREIYVASTVDLAEGEAGPYFVLRRSTDQATLLWGPVDDTGDSGRITGIYSRRPCDRGPLPGE